MVSSDGTDYSIEVKREPMVSFSQSDIANAKELFLEVTLKDGSKQVIEVETKKIKALDFTLK